MTVPQIQPSLSAADSKILNAVFDPESAPEAPQISVDASLPPDAHIHNPELLSSLKSREVAAIKLIEACPKSDEDAQHAVYLGAKTQLDTIITEHPTYASAWNNRAQLQRWRYGDRGVLTTRTPNDPSEQAQEALSAITSALTDLSQAILLASPSTSLRDPSVSPAQGKLLAQAWTQRAAIYWGVAKDLGTQGTSVVGEEWEGWDKTRFEEEGSRAFFMAGL